MKQTRITLFVVLSVTSILFAAAYVWRAMEHNVASQALAANRSPLPTPLTAAGFIDPPVALRPVPRLFSIDLDKPENRGYVKVATLATPNGQSVVTSLRCRRMHFAAGVGICLQDVVGDWLTAAVSVTLFTESFQSIYAQRIDGYASRARIAPDGKYAAFTVFVSGHSYNDADFSTATHIWEVTTGKDLGNLESFAVWRAGKRIDAIDFNFWGITFAKDSNRFYATLRSSGLSFLVEGDIAARRITVLREGVECPSLSPDNRRIAFKKARGNGEWQLTVLDLATLQETPLAEARSVDDQVEWLDDSAILYQQMEYDSTENAWINTLRIPADGGGVPTLFAARVGSPAVVY